MTEMTNQPHDLEWLRGLDGELWESKWQRDRFRSGYVKNERPRRLTDMEWARLRALVADLELPVTMANTRFGFGVGMIIFGPERPWIYPGAEEASRPETITMISQSHLPKSESTHQGEDRRCLFDDGWRCFEPLTHSDVNVSRLRRCGLPEPGPKGDYVY